MAQNLIRVTSRLGVGSEDAHRAARTRRAVRTATDLIGVGTFGSARGTYRDRSVRASRLETSDGDAATRLRVDGGSATAECGETARQRDHGHGRGLSQHTGAAEISARDGDGDAAAVEALTVLALTRPDVRARDERRSRLLDVRAARLIDRVRPVGNELATRCASRTAPGR